MGKKPSSTNVSGTGSDCDHKTSKFLSHGEQSMAGHVGVNGIY
jgi:hypothetical protein